MEEEEGDRPLTTDVTTPNRPKNPGRREQRGWRKRRERTGVGSNLCKIFTTALVDAGTTISSEFNGGKLP